MHNLPVRKLCATTFGKPKRSWNTPARPPLWLLSLPTTAQTLCTGGIRARLRARQARIAFGRTGPRVKRTVPPSRRAPKKGHGGFLFKIFALWGFTAQLQRLQVGRELRHQRGPRQHMQQVVQNSVGAHTVNLIEKLISRNGCRRLQGRCCLPPTKAAPLQKAHAPRQFLLAGRPFSRQGRFILRQ